jgi:hypothetical protein
MPSHIIDDRYIDEEKLHSHLIEKFGRGNYSVRVGTLTAISKL